MFPFDDVIMSHNGMAVFRTPANVLHLMSTLNDVSIEYSVMSSRVKVCITDEEPSFNYYHKFYFEDEKIRLLTLQLATCGDPPLHVNCNECISDWLHSVKKIEMSPDLLKCFFFPKESPRIGDDFGQNYRKRNSSGVIQILQISFIGLAPNRGKYHHLKQCGIHFTDIYIHHSALVSWLENCAVLMTNIWT